MKFFVLACCCLLLGSQSDFAQKKGTTGAKMSDQQFVDFAAQTDMVEANLGKLAGTASSTQAVKDYGEMLVTDHTSDYSQLSTVAQQAGLKLPSAIDPERQKMIAPFYKLKGEAFDKKYAAEMTSGHSKAIEVYRKEADDAQNSGLKSYTQQTLRVLQKHLDGAKNLEQESAKK